MSEHPSRLVSIHGPFPFQDHLIESIDLLQPGELQTPHWPPPLWIVPYWNNLVNGVDFCTASHTPVTLGLAFTVLQEIQDLSSVSSGTSMFIFKSSQRYRMISCEGTVPKALIHFSKPLSSAYVSARQQDLEHKWPETLKPFFCIGINDGKYSCWDSP